MSLMHYQLKFNFEYLDYNKYAHIIQSLNQKQNAFLIQSKQI